MARRLLLTRREAAEALTKLGCPGLVVRQAAHLVEARVEQRQHRIRLPFDT